MHPLCPPDTVIFPDNGRCYRLVAEKAAWLQAQEQCRAWAGAALAMVDSPAVQRFLVSQVTRYPPPTPERLSGGGPHNAGAGLEERWGWPEARVRPAGLMVAEEPHLARLTPFPSALGTEMWAWGMHPGPADPPPLLPPTEPFLAGVGPVLL